jgi:putative phosphoesterase
LRKIVQTREAFELRSGALRIVAVADTHSRPHPDLARHIERLAPDRIVHAGDIGSETVLRDLEKLAPVTAVRGNIDELGEPDVVTIDIRDDGKTLLTMLLLHIAVNGPRLRPDVLRLAKREDASLVVCGHSHVPFANHDHGVTVFNPGSAGPRRFHLPILFGVIDVRRDGVSVQHVDCETGRPWKPISAPRT